MIYDGQTIVLTIDYESKEVNRPYLFALEHTNLTEILTESRRRIVFSSLLFFVIFIYLGWTFVVSAFLSVFSAIIFTVFAPVILFYLLLKFTDYLSDGTTIDRVKITTVFYFDDNGIKKELDHKKLEYPWENIRKVIENENELFIYYTKIGCYLIPKRVFANFEELNQFKNFLKIKLGDKAKF